MAESSAPSRISNQNPTSAVKPFGSPLTDNDDMVGKSSENNMESRKGALGGHDALKTGRQRAWRAKYYYGVIFLVMNLQAWFFRDYGQKVLAHFHYIKACGSEGQDCCKTLGVLRVSLGCFVFFFVMFLATIRTRKLCEACSTWHSGWWPWKLPLLIISMAAPFFFPSSYIHLYGEITRIGAGIFLVLQLVSVIEFITWWNNHWMPDKKMKQSCSLGLFISIVLYIGSVCGTGAMYFFYGRSLDCTLNIVFIALTAIVLIVIMAISLHSKVNRGFLSSGIMAAYLVFLCCSAIRSEPVNEKCNKQNLADGNRVWITILSFLLAIFVIVKATFSTGIDSRSLKVQKDKVEEGEDIPYNYGFFHMVFALGAMHFAMLFISWNLNNSARKWSIDVGWTSTWVKIVNEWLAATIFLWRLIFPVVRKPKVVNLEEQNAV